MRYSKRSQKRLIIIGLCSIVFLMCVGYAAFSTVLTINSTSEITNAWDVEITNVRGVNDASLTYNDAYDKVEPSISNDKLSVTIQTGLLYPGDTRIYEIEVTNKGNVDAQVTTLFNNVINDSTIFSFDGVSPLGSDGEDVLSPGGNYNPSLLESAEPFDLPAFTNNKRYLYLMIKFKDSVTSQPKDLNPSVTLSINAVQKTENSTIVPNGEETVSTHGLEIPVVTSNDGLYEDDTEAGRYIYRGSNPNNYMTFNGETSGWRIIAFENDGTIKIVRDSSVASMRWDEAGNRNPSTSTYCGGASSVGCNAWVAISNLIGTPEIFTLYKPNGGATGTPHAGTVMQDSSLKTWLNGEYLDNPNSNSIYLGEEKRYIESHAFYVSTPGEYSDTEEIVVDVEQEKRYVWNGKIGLIQATDYMKASTNTLSCISLKTASNSPYQCGIDNYLKSSVWYWTISPFTNDYNSSVWAVTSGGDLHEYYAYNTRGVRPSFYLSSNVNLRGNGSLDSPYEIIIN